MFLPAVVVNCYWIDLCLARKDLVGRVVNRHQLDAKERIDLRIESRREAILVNVTYAPIAKPEALNTRAFVHLYPALPLLVEFQRVDFVLAKRDLNIPVLAGIPGGTERLGDKVRLRQIQSCYAMWKDHMALGVGLNNWEQQYRTVYVQAEVIKQEAARRYEVLKAARQRTG